MSKELLSQIEDIYEVTPVSIFPLAPIYYIALILTVVCAFIGVFLYKRNTRYKNSWKHDAQKELKILSSKSKISHKELFLLLKKIAIRKFPRNEIANLHGDEWISWLNKNLPSKTNWETYKHYISNLYSKEGIIIPANEKRVLLTNISKWL